MRRVALAGLMALLVASGCAGPGIPKDAAAPAHAPESPPPVPAAPGSGASAQVLSAPVLRNMAYRWGDDFLDQIELKEGKFRGKLAPGLPDEIHVALFDRIGRGDLDNDGVEDAAVILVNDPAGAEAFFVLVAVINHGGTPDPRGYLRLGDKLQIGALTIDGGKIYVDVVRPPEGASPIPTQRVRESYQLIGDRLERADLFR